MTQKACVARHVCDFYFIVTFCDLALTLTLLSMPFVGTYAASFVDIYPGTLGECDLFAARLTDPRAQKVKTLHCDLCLDLDPTHDTLSENVKHGLGAAS